MPGAETGVTARTAVTSPAWSLVVDLDGAIEDLPPSERVCALVLARRAGRPVAEVAVPVPVEGMRAESLRKAIEDHLSDGSEQHDSPSPVDSAVIPRLTVVVTTCGDPEGLIRCVDSILASCGCQTSVIVVDNRPATPVTRSAIEQQYSGERRVQLVSEPRRGLSWARNAGIAAAETDLVAWTDDDVVVDRYWAGWLVKAFETAPGVDLVTGLVRPLELDSPAQVWRELRRGYSNGLRPRVWHLSCPPSDAPLFPYTPGRIGTGANMAARRVTLQRLGGFDVELGAGTPAAGGEDLDLILRFLEAGSAVVYEPAAIVSHRHHSDVDELVEQARGYGIGLASYLMKLTLSDPRRWLPIARRVPAAVRHMRALRRGPSSESLDPMPELSARTRRAESVGLAVGVGRDLRRRSARLFGGRWSLRRQRSAS